MVIGSIFNQLIENDLHQIKPSNNLVLIKKLINIVINTRRIYQNI